MADTNDTSKAETTAASPAPPRDANPEPAQEEKPATAGETNNEPTDDLKFKAATSLCGEVIFALSGITFVGLSKLIVMYFFL